MHKAYLNNTFAEKQDAPEEVIKAYVVLSISQCQRIHPVSGQPSTLKYTCVFCSPTKFQKEMS